MTSAVVVALLGACLIALILVSVARREAGAVRSQATADVKEQRAYIKSQQAEAESRLDAVHRMEQSLAMERKSLRKERLRLHTWQDRLEAEKTAQRHANDAAVAAIEAQLLSTAGLNRDDAVAALEARLINQAELAARDRLRRIEAKSRREAEALARQVLVSTAQRLVVPASSAASVTTIELPAAELRGRIIGKEGRNVRTFEALSGVDVILEDQSTTVNLASYDTARREIAAVAMTELLADGRISPQRIEEALERAEAGAEERTAAAGQAAADDVGITGLSAEVIHHMGQLRLRTSFGQNVLQHSVETGKMAALLAAETGANVALARRAGFLHDIGKALPGVASHALAGAELLTMQGERADVVAAVAAHHNEVPVETLEAVLVQIADALSASRPGARREDVAAHVQRLERMEEIARAFSGVARVLVMSAGRDVRVVVEPDLVDDQAIEALAASIAQAIEESADPVGVVTVTVVRELRAIATTGTGDPSEIAPNSAA